jgi:predicted nuclease with TOPRIM domain
MQIQQFTEQVKGKQQEQLARLGGEMEDLRAHNAALQADYFRVVQREARLEKEWKALIQTRADKDAETLAKEKQKYKKLYGMWRQELSAKAKVRSRLDNTHSVPGTLISSHDLP